MSNAYPSSFASSVIAVVPESETETLFFCLLPHPDNVPAIILIAAITETTFFP